VLLAAIVLAVTLALGTSPTPAPPPATFASHLPTTQPGLSPDEGVFLSTTAVDGTPVNYFVAQNSRHSILQADLLTEEQINPLWPWRTASRAEVMAYPEASAIGSAAVGLLPGTARAAAPVQADDTAAADSAPTVAELAAPDEVDSQPSVYVLKAGDNLIRVSARYGTTVQAILDNNGLTNANRIFIGQTLIIPGQTDTPAVAEEAPTVAQKAPAVAQAAPTVAEEAPTVAEQVPTVAEQAPTVAEQAPSVADAPETTADTTYTVQRGDSAIIIARRSGISEQALLEANGIRNANLVMIGQILTIPGNG
jgi:LysM repeat protein